VSVCATSLLPHAMVGFAHVAGAASERSGANVRTPNNTAARSPRADFIGATVGAHRLRRCESHSPLSHSFQARGVPRVITVDAAATLSTADRLRLHQPGHAVPLPAPQVFAVAGTFPVAGPHRMSIAQTQAARRRRVRMVHGMRKHRSSAARIVGVRDRTMMR